MKSKEIDLEILKLTVHELASVKDDLVFVGGAIISLHIDEPQHIVVRETFDVDCVVEATLRTDYERVVKKLRLIGFGEDMESHIIGRFRKNDLILDLLPTDSKILGYSNQWYPEGYKNHIVKSVGGVDIKIFDLPYLVATKIEAFKGRGNGHFNASHDIEDIVTLFDGCSEIVKSIKSSEKHLKNYLITEITNLLKNPNFISSLDEHISDRVNIGGRKQTILSRMNALI